jgi:LPS export ABC transporter protein LptC
MRKALIILVVALAGLSGCESSLKEVQRMGEVSFNPIGVSEDIDLKYTENGKVQAVLKSPKMLDYTQLQYGFNEFPDGVHLTLYDDKAQQTVVVADYAIRYEGTDIIDLQGNVKITSSDGNVLTTPQLYFDQKNQWFYTEKNFKFTDNKGGYYEGPGIDFSKDFKVVNMQQNKGRLNNLN